MLFFQSLRSTEDPGKTGKAGSLGGPQTETIILEVSDYMFVIVIK